MGKLLNHLFGLLMPNTTGQRDTPAERTLPAQIPYAHTAPELCMLPKDGPSITEWANAHRNIAPQRGEERRSVVQFKADGIRALYIDGRIVSREGAPLDCALHCQPGLARIEAAAGLGPLVFDGEYVAQDGFNATLGELKAGKGEGVFWVFDMLPLTDWQAGRCFMGVEDRLDVMRDVVCENNDSLFVGALDHWIMAPPEAVAKAREIWAAGGEGIVVKRSGSPYVRNRSDHWMRIKETHTVDGQIVDLMARPYGTLKRMVVRVNDRASPKPKTIVAGTGWTEGEGRALLHNNAAAGIGTWVEIAFQLTTGETRSIRGARFVRRRASKGAAA